MKSVKGFWLPDGEEHLVPFLENGPEFAGGPTYQLKKLMMCMPHVKNFRTAVDVGAHCGLWARPLAQMFRRVVAFEPTPAHLECLDKNLEGRIFPDRSPPGCVEVHAVALGDKVGPVTLHTAPTSSGDTYISDTGEIGAVMKRLDDYRLVDVDFIKIDTEGYESFILAGGEATIKKNRPFVIVEQKPGKGKQFVKNDHLACEMLSKWGAAQAFEISGDFGFVFR